MLECLQLIIFGITLILIQYLFNFPRLNQVESLNKIYVNNKSPMINQQLLQELSQECNLHSQLGFYSTSDYSQDNIDRQSDLQQFPNLDDDPFVKVFQMPEDEGPDDSLSKLIEQIQAPFPRQSSTINIQLQPVLTLNEQKQKNKSQNHNFNSGKNSNAIKKIGRIILTWLQKFKIKDRENEGVLAMMKLLQQNVKPNSRPADRIDNFNFSHLEALFYECDPKTSRFNLFVARRLINYKLRKDIFGSSQIKGNKKLVYLNTLKCTNLRLCNRSLSLRLQLKQKFD